MVQIDVLDELFGLSTVVCIINICFSIWISNEKLVDLRYEAVYHNTYHISPIHLSKTELFCIAISLFELMVQIDVLNTSNTALVRLL